MVYHIQYMPSQPDVYNVRRNIMDKMPESISDLLYDEGISAELSSCPEIMRRALVIERGQRAKRMRRKASPEDRLRGHALKLRVISEKRHKPLSPTRRRFSPPARQDTLVIKKKADTRGGMNWGP